MSDRRNAARLCAAWVVALAWLIALAGMPTPAPAAACPNAQFRSGPAEHLPDCRAYEQVSPIEKAGADAVSAQAPQPAQGSNCEAGEECTIAYMNEGGAFSGTQGNDFANAYIATRGAEGWRTTALAPPAPQPPANGFGRVSYAFSNDLSNTVLRVPLQQLAEGAPAGVYNLFLRTASGGYSLVTAAEPPQPPQAGCGSCFEQEDVPAFAGASADFSHVIFEADDSLEGAPAGVESLYEAFAGRVRPVGVLPDGTLADGSTAGGGIEAIHEHAHELAHAISEDGSHVLFEAPADKKAPYEQEGKLELYDRIDGSTTVEVSAPGPGAQPERCETPEATCKPASAQFWAASPDGSLVYFTSGAALTRDSYAGVKAGSLYRYDVETGMLTNLIAQSDPAAGAAGASVLGVVGTSEDGSYVYFVASGVLAASAPDGQPGPVAGRPNLYVWHGVPDGSGALTLIATLATPTAGEEANIEAGRAGTAFPYDSDVADWTSRPTESQAYVTPDGHHLAFMSAEPLTGYESDGDHEVFEYGAESGQLECASCDRDGAAPLGGAFIGAQLTERASTPFHQPRVLSDNGARLFFSSPDPLVSGLTGGPLRLFEYENGTVQQISGPGEDDAMFLDASASGNDVFFATRDKLAPTDDDELVDVYDARVDGGLPAASVVPSCQGECGGPSAVPQPLAFPSPASASFAGAGNLVTQPPKLTRSQLLGRALAKCDVLKRRRKRSECISAARRRYGPVRISSARAGVGGARHSSGR